MASALMKQMTAHGLDENAAAALLAEHLGDPSPEEDLAAAAAARDGVKVQGAWEKYDSIESAALTAYLSAVEGHQSCVNVIAMQETHLVRGEFVGEHISACGWNGVCSYPSRVGGPRQSNHSFKGYSGVATLFKVEALPCATATRFPPELMGTLERLKDAHYRDVLDSYRVSDLHDEGRILCCDLGDFLFFNVYLPSTFQSISNPDRVPWMWFFLLALAVWVKHATVELGRRVVVAGDFQRTSDGSSDPYWLFTQHRHLDASYHKLLVDPGLAARGIVCVFACV
jgi:exonuclease III